MNFQTAAIVAASTGVLSFLFGLIGGVPFFDIVLRALFWAAAGFGGSLGVETLLRKLVPEVFEGAASPEAPSEAAPERAVDIVLDEEAPASGFVEETDDDAEPMRRAPASAAPAPAEELEPEGAAEPPGSEAAPQGEEEMPEIGAFLDAFKPGASGDEEPPAAASPDYGDYTPAASSPQPYGAQEPFMDGEPQDPAVLARAVQTVLKRDSQGN